MTTRSSLQSRDLGWLADRSIRSPPWSGSPRRFSTRAAQLAQAKRRARKVGGGAGGAGGAGSDGADVTAADVQAVHAAVHAEAAGREPAGKTKNARRTRVEFAERVEWLPRLRLMQTIIAAPDRETLVQMQIVGTVIDTLRLRGVIGNGMKFPEKPVHLPWEKTDAAKVEAASS